MRLKASLKDKEDANDHDGTEDIWCKTAIAGASISHQAGTRYSAELRVSVMNGTLMYVESSPYRAVVDYRRWMAFLRSTE